jgi:hypothetical protein
MQICTPGDDTEPVPPFRSSAEPGGFVREMGLVVPVVDRLADVDHAEQDQKDHRQHEGELDQRDTTLVGQRRMPSPEPLPSPQSPAHRRRN